MVVHSKHLLLCVRHRSAVFARLRHSGVCRIPLTHGLLGPHKPVPPKKWHPDHFIRFGTAQPPKYVVCSALQRAEHPSKLVLPVMAWDPHLTRGSLGPHESPPNKRHLDWLVWLNCFREAVTRTGTSSDGI